MEHSIVIEGLLSALQPMSLLMILIGVFVGIIVGVIPGIGAGVGLALLLPVIFSMPPLLGLMLLIALWAADGYGGSISSILLNVPGGAGAVATCFDGHPMAKQGKAGEAIGTAMGASMTAGIMGATVLMLVAPPLAALAVKIGPAEYTILGLLGITLIGGMSANEPVKGIVSACFGLMASFIGYDLMTGFVRYNLGLRYLFDGVSLMLVLVGLFAIASLTFAGQEGGTVAEAGKISGSVAKGFIRVFTRPLTILRGSFIGIILGIMPGIGITLASLMAYDVEKRSSKHPERFGTGVPEGVMAPECANNAVQPSALIPTLTLGIPGSSTSAIFLGALIMYGISPGMQLFERSGELVWGLMWGIMIACVSFVIVGLLFANFFARLTILPIEYLVPITLVTCFIGAFTESSQIGDLLVVLLFGAIGFMMMVLKFPAAPAILGIVLGPILERNYFRALLISEHSYAIFYASALAKMLWILLFFAIFGPTIMKFIRSFRAKGA